MTHADWLATVLHLFGLDKDKLTFKRNARDTTLTDGAGSLVKQILAWGRRDAPYPTAKRNS